ncbi:sugar ABC transporter ATP-binding protein [Rubrobacter calidifluminis]|uniref:sugar ABC transporter ATP-binding protein n=1 Tax=Rubrobacter calidifluminis TaxID=1392640 RepID=UPI0023625A9C|nr:sugar ABC transporter ATP-binding protein [Rubrobacter calidifluminis]
MAAESSSRKTAVELKGITKSFAGNAVLHGVDFQLLEGEVHALVGGNGAGKSTLMKILQGVYVPDSGEIRIGGTPVQIRSTQDAKDHGIAMIFQEFSLIPTLSVAQNVFLNSEPRTKTGFLDDRECERRARALFAELDEMINPKAVVASLSTGYWQLTEIAKALAQDARILIMDEPTASLARTETEALFKLIKKLKQRDISIIYISHRMEEIFRIADRVTVLRNGRRVITAEVADLTSEAVIEHIVGRKLEAAFEWKERQVERDGSPLLEVEGLSASGRFQDVTFSLYPGEILGIAGLMGSGRTEIARALFGIDRIEAGEIRIRGRRVSIHDTQSAMEAGIALIPEDRRLQGLVLDHSLKDNLLLPLLSKLGRGGMVNDRRGEQVARSFVERLQIKLNSIFDPVRLLSGGTQQKVVIAKWLAAEPEILIMDEPTAGVDIGTKTEILEIIRQLAEEGKGIIMISSELTELLAVSDRILVLQDGTVRQTLERKDVESEEMLHHAVQGI